MWLHPACLSVDALLAECAARRQRRGGPGGQHRNKVETAVVLVHRPTGVSAEANERRSQAENLRQAVIRLRVKLALAVRSPVSSKVEGAPTASDLWRARTKSGRIAVSTEHEDFPAMLAEALDAMDAADYDVSAAAARLEVSPSQLGKFVQKVPAAWTLVNGARRSRGLRPLK